MPWLTSLWSLLPWCFCSQHGVYPSPPIKWKSQEGIVHSSPPPSPPTPPPCFLHPSLTPTILGLTLAVRDFIHSNQWKHRCNPTHLGKRVWLHEPEPPALESYSQALPISGLLSASLETTLRKQGKAMQEIWGGGDLGKEKSKENTKVYNKGNNALSPLLPRPPPPPLFPLSP